MFHHFFWIIKKAAEAAFFSFIQLVWVPTEHLENVWRISH